MDLILILTVFFVVVIMMMIVVVVMMIMVYRDWCYGTGIINKLEKTKKGRKTYLLEQR